jgi:hypothetical protein
MNPFAMRNMEHHERIFNYRICRARRLEENAFGILVHKFRFCWGPWTRGQRHAEKSSQLVWSFTISPDWDIQPRTWSTANEQRKQVRCLQKVTRWHPNHTKATRWLHDVVLRVRCVRTRSRRRHVNLREGNLYLLTYYYINEYTSALK